MFGFGGSFASQAPIPPSQLNFNSSDFSTGIADTHSILGDLVQPPTQQQDLIANQSINSSVGGFSLDLLDQSASTPQSSMEVFSCDFYPTRKLSINRSGLMPQKGRAYRLKEPGFAVQDRSVPIWSSPIRPCSHFRNLPYNSIKTRNIFVYGSYLASIVNTDFQFRTCSRSANQYPSNQSESEHASRTNL